MTQGESTIINIRNERRNIRANLTAIRKDDTNTVLCGKKNQSTKKEATSCLQVSKKGKKKNNIEISFAQEETQK